MQDPATQRAVLATSESGLLCLPQGPWHAIWTELRDDQAALHAMRCSCRALRDFSTPLINAARVYFTNTHEADANEDEVPGNVLQLNVATAASQLTGFPATAKLSRLQLFCLTNAAKVSNVIPNLFFCTAPRLAAITNLKVDYPHVVSMPPVDCSTSWLPASATAGEVWPVEQLVQHVILSISQQPCVIWSHLTLVACAGWTWRVLHSTGRQKRQRSRPAPWHPSRRPSPMATWQPSPAPALACARCGSRARRSEAPSSPPWLA